MKCKKVKSLLLDFYEGELPKDREKMIADHLTSCPSCLEELKVAEKVMEIVKARKLNDPGADFWDSFLPKVKEALSSEKAGDTKYSLPRRANDLIANLAMKISVPKIRYATISIIAGIALISFVSLKLALKTPEIGKEAKNAIKNLEEAVIKEGYSQEIIENVLASSESNFLFSRETPQEASYSEMKGLYDALVASVINSGLSEETCSGKEGFLNGSHIYWEIEELDEQELKFFSEELRLRYSST